MTIKYIIVSDKEKTVVNAIFGNGAKDENTLGKVVYQKYGVAKDGFNISSCQFAVHYFFESKYTLHSFLRNLTECTAVNGYFIGTCYDGNTVFEMLKHKQKNEGITIMKNEKNWVSTKFEIESGFESELEVLGVACHGCLGPGELPAWFRSKSSGQQ
jgi:hypothetical protein